MGDTYDLETPGQEVTEDLDDLRAEVTSYFGVGPRTFVGAQPVSLDLDNVSRIREERYLVCEKTDGVRFLLYADEQSDTSCYLIDRKRNFWEVDITIPESARPCLLDGELIRDKVEGNPQGEVRFLIFDLMVVKGEEHFNDSYDKRLVLAYDNIIVPQMEEFLGNDEVKLYLKDFFETSELKHLYDSIVPKLPHENDGLIFTKVDMIYKPGTHEEIIKWKPPELNSIDFCLQEDFSIWVVGEGKKLERFGQVYPITQEEHDRFSKLIQDNKNNAKPTIVECGFRRDRFMDYKGKEHANGWRIDRIRSDKMTANFVTVVEKIRKSIDDNITIAKLEEIVNVSPYNGHKKQRVS